VVKADEGAASSNDSTFCGYAGATCKLFSLERTENKKSKIKTRYKEQHEGGPTRQCQLIVKGLAGQKENGGPLKRRDTSRTWVSKTTTTTTTTTTPAVGSWLEKRAPD